MCPTWVSVGWVNPTRVGTPATKEAMLSVKASATNVRFDESTDSPLAFCLTLIVKGADTGLPGVTQEGKVSKTASKDILVVGIEAEEDTKNR